ncbi:MAG: alkaline phosphatase family protein [Gemmatimonadetes bacterium]|nr:alkaline phosphatase family protein [Gemmatimonadota bacterium]
MLQVVTTPRGDHRWDLLIRATGMVALTGIPLVLLFPHSVPLVWFAVLSLPANSPLSPVIPALFEPLIMEAAKWERPIWVATVALAGYMYMEYLNWHAYAWLLSRKRLESLRGRHWVRASVGYFDRAPFLTIIVFAFTPMPFWTARCLAILGRYPLSRFLSATALGRFPRFLFYAWFGALLQIPVVILLAVVVGSAAVAIALRLARGQRLQDEAAAAGEARSGALRGDRPARVAAASDQGVTLIILDGARPDVFQHLAAAGDLPNTSRWVLEPGGVAPATTVLPSTTGVAYLPFLTGCYPGTCNVPGIRWLDPAQYGGAWWTDREHVRSYCGYQGKRLNTDVPDSVLSLFDIEPDSVGLCTPFWRRLTPGGTRMGLVRAGLGWQAHYTGWYLVLDQAVGRQLARIARGRHRLVFAVFPGVDGLTHFFDPWHPRVLEVYRHFDRALGRYAARGGFEGDRLVAIVSDHGMARVDRHTDVALALERRGLPALRHPILWRRDPDVAVMVSGNASAQLYLRPGVKRSQRWSVPAIESGEVAGIPRDLVSYLAALDGIAFVAGTDGRDIVVHSSAGRARLSPDGDGRISYHPETADVLKLGDLRATRASGEWLTASLDGPFPDAPTQLLQLFRSPRAGDLIVAAALHTDLRSAWEIPPHRSGHGSLVHDHMRCLVALNRPVRGPLRTVDLFALALSHLGHAIPPGIDAAYAGDGARTRRPLDRPDRLRGPGSVAPSLHAPDGAAD